MLRISAAILALMVANGASAATITYMSGDDDCFGINDPCIDGEILVVPPSFDNSNVSDPAGQDQFGEIGVTTFDFNLDPLALNNPLSATFSFKTFGLELIDTRGLGDAFAGARILMNGVDVALYDPNGISPSEVDVVSFAIDPTSLLATNTFSIIPEEAFETALVFEDYAIDFAKLTVEANMSGPPPPPPTGPTPVPLPATGLLLLAGLGGAAALRKRAI